jgi:hypothetical protein
MTLRRAIAIGLVTLASVLAFVAVLAIWVDRQALNTANWTSASSEMLQHRVVRDRVAEYLVEELYANVDVAAEIRAALPERAQPLAAPAAAALRDLVERSAKQALARPRAQQAWEDANRSAHELFLHVLRGGGPVVSTEQQGAVDLDLTELLRQLDQRTGVGGGLAERLPPSAAQITVLRSDQLESAQSALRVLDALPIVSVVGSLLLFGAALLVAPRWRRQAVRAYGLGLVAAGAAGLAAVSLGRDAVVDALVPTAAGLPAAREVWTIGTALLEQVAYATLGYGALLVAGAWLAGPSRPAAWVRRGAAPYAHEPAIAYAAFAVVAVAAVFWWSPTPAMRNPVTAIAILVLVACGFEGLRRRTVREFPDADRQAFERRVRARVGEAYQSVRAGAASGGSALTQKAASARRELADRASSSSSTASSHVDELERLAALRDSGVLNDDEFLREKTRVLGAPTTGAPV